MRWIFVITVGVVLGSIAAAFTIALHIALNYMSVIR